MGGSSKRTAREKSVKDWRKRALDLRVSGLTFRQVAAKLNKSVATVHEACEQELAAIPSESAERYRDLRRDQLEGTLAKHWPKRGEPEHARVIVSVITTLMKLDGLAVEESTAIAITGSVHTAHDDVLGLLAAIVAKGAVGGSDPEPDSGTSSPAEV